MSCGFRFAGALSLCAPSMLLASDTLSGGAIQVEIRAKADVRIETVSVKLHDRWVSALEAVSVVHVMTSDGMRLCALKDAKSFAGGLLLTGDCGPIGTFEQRLTLGPDSDLLNVSTRVTLNPGTSVHSVEDRYSFVPMKHTTVDEHLGPLDFVWSQNIKSEAGDLIPASGFKSPAVMMQQDRIFTALLPNLSSRHVETRALDLDVTSEERPWIAYGAIPSDPHDHSYFRRSVDKVVQPIANVIEYQYTLVVSDQPSRLGFRRAVRLLWERTGRPALLNSSDAQQNAVRPELRSFNSWREEAWHQYADSVYSGFNCNGHACGTLSSDRNYKGIWKERETDGWFNAWFQSLRSAYGWYLHARATRDVGMMQKAESVLNLALSSPQNHGAFPTIYLAKNSKWIPGDAWAGYADSYDTFSMSWTAYWMLRWAEDLTPERKGEILRFVRPYGDFLLANQDATGVIPSWFLASTVKPRDELHTFNAEAAPSALLLAALGHATNDQRYTAGAARAMAFVKREVVPRQRWFDFETYLSCARKPYDFFDRWTTQYPQNNLAELQAPQAMLALYQSTHNLEDLHDGEQMLDYVLLTQQVWSNPAFTPNVIGGFTTQNTDAEWSDARQGYAATLLFDYYRVTGKIEYLERSVAAARSTFAVAPWENWAHKGYLDEPGSLTGFHWGTGSAMTTVEMLSPTLGDALIDLRIARGIGFDDCTITDVAINAGAIRFTISSSDPTRKFLVRFAGADPSKRYTVRWNGKPPVSLSGKTLRDSGVSIGPL